MVASFNRPGANVTGVTFLSNKLVAKRLELLAALISPAARIGMLAHTNNPNTAADVRDALAAAAALGKCSGRQRVASLSELDAAVTALVQQRIAALFVAPQADFRNWQQQILALAERNALPTSFSNSDFVVAGGLMSYGPNQPNPIVKPVPIRGAFSRVKSRRNCQCWYQPSSILLSI